MIEIVCYTNKTLKAFGDSWIEMMYLRRAGWKSEGHVLTYHLTDEDYEYIVSKYPPTDREEEIKKWQNEK